MTAFRLALPDLAIIDIGLGDEIDGGFTLCRDLRAQSNSLPIIFLSARDSDFDVVSGLRLGADDYVAKDVSMPHLTARIAALFRRLEAQRAPARAEDVLHRGELVLDINRLSISWKQQEVILTVTEFWMIHALVKFVGHVKNRDQLMREAELTVDDNTITSHMKRIRKKFEVVDKNFDAIETVYGMGYRWRA
jgi:two-component system OmpR family response regulator